jgi:glycosyltransferase involved in cell wall biosynthesis
VGDRVTFLGYVDDHELQRLYRQSEIFAFPSLQEGFGFALLEAMAHGLPVVTTTAGPIPGSAGECLLAVPPGDSRALAEGLRTLLGDLHLRRSLGARAREHVKLHYSWEATTNSLMDLYRTLSGGG